MSAGSKKPTQYILTARSALLILIAMIVSVAAGALTYLACRSVPESILAAASAFGGSLLWLNKVIGS